MSIYRQLATRSLRCVAARTAPATVGSVSALRLASGYALNRDRDSSRSNARSTGRRSRAPQQAFDKPNNDAIEELTRSREPIRLEVESLPRLILNRVDEWAASERVKARCVAFGFDSQAATECLDVWTFKIKEDLLMWDDNGESLITQMAACGWDANALILAYESGNFAREFENAFLRNFIEYAAESGPLFIQSHLKALLEATDVSRHAQTYLQARSINRHFHLHMGPTNSGKTYQALKALSRAKTGVYAGPLRLLAHEVWERLNMGSVGDLNGEGRATNLLTGEERRNVHNAGLVSCTIEMLPFYGNAAAEPWDVVVIDEIQMMADDHRGGAWTNAVLGVNAKEVHLCGDETTAHLLQSMVDSFKGDTLTIHRYNRLTPLVVAPESLNGKYENVQPGDCVVTFSRNNVYSVKKNIEGTLGKKCAVVYGALPPETRAEQARDFNEDEGRSQVLVASDAVGMGLNLKIGRVVFASMTKFDGQRDVPLSLTQVKQIAGRAGRFGQGRTTVDNEDDNAATTDEVAAPGGVVTTLHAADLPLLRAMLPLTLPAVTRAVFELPNEALTSMLPLVHPTTTYADLLDHTAALAKLPPNMVLSETRNRLALAEVLEEQRDVLTATDIVVFSNAPVNTRDPKVAGIFQNIVQAYATDYHVDVEEVLKKSTLLHTLKTVEETLAALPPLPPHLGIFRQYLVPPITVGGIPLLESLHKALVLYIWLSFRYSLAFPDRELATAYKLRTEKVLEICLERLPGVRQLKSAERTKEMDKELALFRRKYVDKHGLVKPSIKWVNQEQEERMRKMKRWRSAATEADEVTEIHDRTHKTEGSIQQHHPKQFNYRQISDRGSSW